MSRLPHPVANVGPVSIERIDDQPSDLEVIENGAQSGISLGGNPQGRPARSGGIKVRLTLGPALIDLEATLEEIVVVVTRLTQEFTSKQIISQQ